MHIHGNQIKTLNLQISYDTKLNNATYDALKAFQLNTVNSDTSDLANSKLRDIEASANTFFTSIASNFNMAGYDNDVLSEYVPALVYTMYDGYYIYSKYTNTLDNVTKNAVVNDEGVTEYKTDAEILNSGNTYATYKEGDSVSGLKPYIYYSCRYKYNGNDFVITYSLDNYITIQGTINGKWVFDYGYLLDNIGGSENNITYRGIEIDTDEKLEEYVYDIEANKINKYEYIKINGVKYYKNDKGDADSSNDEWFTILNGKKYPAQNLNPSTTSAKEYYKKADEFKERIKNTYNLSDLRGSDARDENGNPITQMGDYKIFDFEDTGSIEDPDSNFNQQRLAAIRYSIEKNLSIAIANYNKYSGVTANFQMPTLKENEWDKIINNVSIISFMQGLSIGGKMYNGYSIITNTKNEEVVSEDSIYILTDDNKYHRANDNDLIGYSGNCEGVLNIDFEVKSALDVNGNRKDFMPKQNSTNHILGCYNSIVSQSGINATDNLYKYIAGSGNDKLATAYFTALGRERYSMYKTNNNSEMLKKEFGMTDS